MIIILEYIDCFIMIPISYFSIEEAMDAVGLPMFDRWMYLNGIILVCKSLDVILSHLTARLAL